MSGFFQNYLVISILHLNDKLFCDCFLRIVMLNCSKFGNDVFSVILCRHADATRSVFTFPARRRTIDWETRCVISCSSSFICPSHSTRTTRCCPTPTGQCNGNTLSVIKINDDWLKIVATKSADFSMTGDRFLLADFIGRQNRPTLSIVRHPLKAMCILSIRRNEPLSVVVDDKIMFWRDLSGRSRTPCRLLTATVQ